MFKRISAAFQVLLLAAGAALAQPPVFINLGTVSQANDVSADGSVVVGTHVVSGVNRVFRWTQGGGMQDIGTGTGALPMISGDGNVVGWDNQRWTAQTGAATFPLSTVSGISFDGSTMIGGASVWRAGVGATQLHSAPGDPPELNAYVYGVTADGSTIVGGYSVDATHAPAAPWIGTIGESLGGIPGFPVDAECTTITPDGSTIYGFGRGQGGYDAFRWTAATGIVPLGVAAGGFNLPVPTHVSADGQIIIGNTLNQGFVWRVGAGPRLIQDILENDYGIDLGNLLIEQARGVSADGKTVVGFGTDMDSGQRFGWIVNLPWSIPGPGAGSVLILAGFGAARRRRTLA